MNLPRLQKLYYAIFVIEQTFYIYKKKFFFTVDEVDKIVKKINVTFGGATIQYPLPNRDKGCEELQGLTCPLYQGDTVTFSIIMQVLKAYPKVS